MISFIHSLRRKGNYPSLALYLKKKKKKGICVIEPFGGGLAGVF